MNILKVCSILLIGNQRWLSPKVKFEQRNLWGKQ